MKLLDKFSISAKVMTGFGVVITLLVVISGISLLSLMTADRHFKDYRALARQTVADGRVQANMLMTRIYAKNFVIDANKDNIKGVEERAQATIEMIEQARDLTSNVGFNMILDNLERELQDYIARFHSVTEKQAQRNTLVHDTLNVIGPQMEKDLTAIMESAFADGDTEAAYRAGITMRNLLLARLYAGRFLIQNDNASFQRVGQEFLGMQNNLDALVSNLADPQRLELAAKVRDDQRKYARAFETVHDIITNRNSIIENQLDAIGPKVADNIERLKLALKSEQDILGPLAEADINRTVGVVLLVSIVSIIFGVASAWVIGFGVSRKIRSMAKSMKELADGNLDVRMDTRHSSHEIREMAAAVEVFRDSMVKVSKLADEQSQAAEKIRVARDAADAANQAKSAFLANMSHELRTPMNAILGYSEMLIDEAGDTGQEDFIPDLKKIHQAGSHLLALINDILDLSKVESGKMEAYAEDISIDSLIDDVSSTAQPLLEKNNNSLSIERTGEPGTAYQDMTKLRQVLFNLLSNAAKFTHDGTITLHVNRTSQDNTDWLTFAVSDTGIGIAKDKLQHVFDEFAQADGSTTRNYGGTGLGLAISRRFCKLLGGELTVDSVVGEGSTFTIRIPAILPETETGQQTGKDVPATPEAVRTDSREADAGSTVLVIDDDPDACEIIEHNLARDGFRVVTAHSGEQGLRLAHEIHPAAITLDVMMPDMDGWSVLRALKADPVLHDTPVIMLTMVDDRSRGYSLGAVDYLTKPVDREQLHKALARYYSDNETCPVLLVDDDAKTRQIMARTMEKSGWMVLEAGNGQEALEILESQQPRLILLDLMMPVMDGFGFLAAMRARPEWQHIPVIVVTAKDLSDLDRRRLSGMVDEVIEKNACTIEQLLQHVRSTINVCNSNQADLKDVG